MSFNIQIASLDNNAHQQKLVQSDQYHKIVEETTNDSCFDKFELSQQTCLTLKVTHDTILLAAIGIFAAALVFTVNTLKDHYVMYLMMSLGNYIQSLSSKIYLGVIGTLAFNCHQLSMMCASTDDIINIEKKKRLDLVIDIEKILIFIISCAFMVPFMVEEDTFGITTAFCVMIFGIILGIIRKIFKWIHFYFGKGKSHLELWSRKNTTNSEVMLVNINELQINVNAEVINSPDKEN